MSVAVLLAGLIWSSSVDPAIKEVSNNISGMPPAVIAISSPDKIKLAEHLTKEGAVMYNAYWCPHCHDQKEMFGKEAAEKLNLVECAKDGFNNKRELCEAKGITGFPSWEINGSIDSGVKSLEELADLTNYKDSKDF
jgi:glutaredoxin